MTVAVRMRKMEKNAAWHFIAIILLPLAWDGSSTSATLPSLPELCPYTNFCTQQANRTLEDPALQSCCLPCSCNVDCGIVDKCCPDVAHSSVPTNVYPCRNQKEIYQFYLKNNNWEGNAKNRYRVIDDCPRKAFNNPDLAGNVAHCYNASELQDLIFVTGIVSGYTYLNKHCAICNNENVYMEWALYLLNRTLLTMNMSFEERDRRILSQGGVISVPPTQDMAMDALCFKTDYRTCNVTGSWNFYDSEIENKCHELTYEYISEGAFGGPFGYANVYCFICNNPAGTPVTPECNAITFDSDRKSGLHGQAFSALLTSQKPIEDQDSVCSAGEVLDPYHLECTALICPIGTAAHGGYCTRMVEDMNGFSVGLELQVVLDNNVDPAAINYDNFADDFIRMLRKSLNSGNTRCGFCSLFLFDSLKNGTMFISAGLQTTERCSVSNLLRGIHKIFPTTSINILLPNVNISAAFLTVEPKTVQQNPYSLLTHRINGHCSREITFDPIEAVYCPSIHLNHDIIHEFADHGNVVSRIMSNSVNIGSGTVRICLDNYVSILKRHQLISGTYQLCGSKMLIAIVTIVLLFICDVICEKEAD